MTQEAHLNEGVVALEMGLRGMPAAAEELMVQRDIDLAAETGGHVHIAHVSTAGSVERIKAAKEMGLPVTAEATPHHLTLTEDLVLQKGTMAKVNPPLRTAEDVQAVIQVSTRASSMPLRPTMRRTLPRTKTAPSNKRPSASAGSKRRSPAWREWSSRAR
jgi:dihydroorotase-like cyclic amidohydrolase